MRELINWVTPTLGFLLVGVVACSSSSNGTSVSADQACGDFATAVCQRLDDCADFLIKDVYGDTTTCSTRVKASCADELAANGTGTTPALREDCTKAIAGTACADLLDNNDPTACQAKAGTLANGTTCGVSSQCQSTYCNLGQDGTCGACGASRASPGGACTRDDDCSYGSICSGALCVVPVASGGTCDMAHPCQGTLTCKNGVCGAPDEAGTACTTGTCDKVAGLYCTVTGSPVCSQIALASAGQPCGVTTNGITACSAGGMCTSGTCQAPAADGAACDDTKGPPCLAPAVCGATSKVCTIPNPTSCQ
jgi:hypothetical protein